MAVVATPQLFKDTSELDIDSSTRIISFSDIHGDIDALIIALRDCAKVIRSRSNIPALGNNIRDPEFDRLLKLNLLDLQEHQEFDANAHLNFEWIGGTTHVVIVGDIIDPVREKTIDKTPIHSHVEIKILKFLNKLDEMAQKCFGRVIKLIGNHEYANFKNNRRFERYMHDPLENMPYINSLGNIETLPRNDYFKLNNHGFKLYMERGSGVFLRINNTLFMHGQVYDRTFPSFTFNKCDTFNKWINNSGHLNEYEQIFIDFVSSAQLDSRQYGYDEFINTRLQDPSNPFCTQVIDDIKSFLIDHPNNINPAKKLNPDNIRIVIGHCIQSDSTAFDELNRTFITQRQIDDVSVELTKPAETFKGSRYVDNNLVFGITMECPDISEPHHKVYKVDVGTSRGFDQLKAYQDVTLNPLTAHTFMKRYFLSRVPQVLEFLGDTVRIIRSTLKNTRIHQIRKIFEEEIDKLVASKKLPDDMTVTNMTYGGYKEKYLKYKNKYLNLKNLIV